MDHIHVDLWLAGMRLHVGWSESTRERDRVGSEAHRGLKTSGQWSGSDSLVSSLSLGVFLELCPELTLTLQ